MFMTRATVRHRASLLILLDMKKHILPIASAQLAEREPGWARVPASLAPSWQREREKRASIVGQLGDLGGGRCHSEPALEQLFWTINKNFHDPRHCLTQCIPSCFVGHEKKKTYLAHC